MKLSDAIRLGAMSTAKADGVFYRDGATCAQGAALLAIGKLVKEVLMQHWNHNYIAMAWPWAALSGARHRCPVASCLWSSFALGIIAHLNNSVDGGHGWTREQIADWVATVEPADSPIPGPVLETVEAQ